MMTEMMMKMMKMMKNNIVFKLVNNVNNVNNVNTLLWVYRKIIKYTKTATNNNATIPDLK